MKIFGWMHRKIRRNVDLCMVFPKEDFDSFDGEKSNKAPSMTNEGDTRALLLYQPGSAPFVDSLSGWQDGILSIGTFGMDGFALLGAQYLAPNLVDYSTASGEEALGKKAASYPPNSAFKEEEEAFQAEIDEADDGVAKSDDEDDLKSEIDPVDHGSVFVGADDHPIRAFPSGTEEIICVDPNKAEKKTKKEGERTTLADLFNADALPGKFNNAEAEKKKKKKLEEADHLPAKIGVKNQPNGRSKQVRSLAKKLVPWKTQDSRPTAKLHRLVTKILKRKIHPNLGDQELEVVYNGITSSIME